MSNGLNKHIRTLPLPIYRFTSVAFGAGASLEVMPFDAHGYQLVRGYLFTSAAAAAGFPRIRMSADGTNFDLTFAIPIDPTQPANTHTFSLAVQARFISFEYTAGGAPATVRADVELVP
jgi:hypothetical protein